MENGDVLWAFAVDSHETLVQKHGLQDDGRPRNWARFEIAPDNGSYLSPDTWGFKLDEECAVPWFTDWHKGECYKAHRAWLKKLNRILVHKPFVHPFKDVRPPKITKKHLALLRQWSSVWASVGDSVGDIVRDSVWDIVRDGVGASVWASVRASVWDSVGASVWASVGDIVGDIVRDSVRASVWDSVGASVWASVGDSVWDSVGAYLGSFFRLPRKEWQYTEGIKGGDACPFQPAVDLWEMGLVPSFDGKLWRLHGGKDGKVLWEGTI
jgi:hypothetical protein